MKPLAQILSRIGVAGRIRPVLFGILIMVVGILLDQSWWKVGGVILIVVFVRSIYRYQAMGR